MTEEDTGKVGEWKMSEFRDLLRENSLDGWKIYPRGIFRYVPGGS